MNCPKQTHVVSVSYFNRHKTVLIKICACQWQYQTPALSQTIAIFSRIAGGCRSKTSYNKIIGCLLCFLCCLCQTNAVKTVIFQTKIGPVTYENGEWSIWKGLRFPRKNTKYCKETCTKRNAKSLFALIDGILPFNAENPFKFCIQTAVNSSIPPPRTTIHLQNIIGVANS